MTLRRNVFLIEVISEANHNSFIKCIKWIQSQKMKERIVLFGAGTMGTQFLYLLLESFGEQTKSQIVFCDNDQKKWGYRLENKLIISPDDLHDNDLIVITIERYERVYNQLLHYVSKGNVYTLTNKDESVCAEQFYTKRMDAETLVIGDCELEKVCYSDDIKKSISSLLMDNERIKVVSCNGLYVRQQYEMIMILIGKMPNLKQMFLTAVIRNIHNSYHLYPNNQHVNLFSKIIENDNEGFLNLLREREAGTKVFEKSISNSGTIDEKECIREQNIDMRAFYMYRIDESNESVMYLDYMSKELNYRGVEFKLIMLPINYERGMRLSSGVLQKSLQRSMDILAKGLKKDELVNLSDFVPEKDYVGINTL